MKSLCKVTDIMAKLKKKMNSYNLILFFVTLKCKKRKASSHYLTVLHRFTLDTQSNSINRHLKKNPHSKLQIWTCARLYNNQIQHFKRTKILRNKIRKFYKILFSGLCGDETDGYKKFLQPPPINLLRGI